MKKLLCLLLLFAMTVVSIMSCSNDNEDNTFDDSIVGHGQGRMNRRAGIILLPLSKYKPLMII